MAVGDVYRMTRKVLMDGQTVVNVLHFLQTVDVGPDEESALHDAWDSPSVSDCPELKLMQACLGFTSLSLVGYEIQKILPSEGDVEVFTIDSTPPAATDSGLPTFSGLKVVINTDLISRSGRGGFHLCGIPEGSTDGNNLTSFGLGKVQFLLDAINKYFDPSEPDYKGFVIGVYSRLLNQFNPATTLTAGSLLGTMRSRKAGRGI